VRPWRASAFGLRRDTQWWQYIINYGIQLFPLFLAISSFPLAGTSCRCTAVKV